MTRDHALWPDSDAEQLHRLVRVKQHPDRQPGRAVAVNGRNDNNGRRDQNFESKGIQDGLIVQLFCVFRVIRGFVLRLRQSDPRITRNTCHLYN